ASSRSGIHSMPQFLPRIARYPRPRHSAVQSTSPVPIQTPLPNRCANPQFLSRRQAKPIKEPASRYGLVHRAVYSIPRRADVLLLLGFPPPRNRANLFQSLLLIRSNFHLICWFVAVPYP